MTRETFARRFRRLAARLTPDDGDALLGALVQQDVAAGEVVITEGAPVDALLLVWDGELNVTVDDVEVAHVGPGAFLGEASLLDPGPASATVAADQGCTILRLERAAFDELCTTRPGLANVLLEELSRVLASRVRAAGERLDDLMLQQEEGMAFAGAADVAGVHRRLLQDGPA